jgi:LmbE family N-acetylglucosaminyl deacetylase/glycosyltransferase involved in cell wall biosynthesis
MTEADAIPFEASQLRGERLLVLAPHPDDEAIACGGLIALHTRENRPVRVVVATDGCEAIATTDREGYGETREQESRRGIETLGGADIEFLRFPDRQLSDHGGDLATRLAATLRDFRPDLVLLPSVVEIHPDHLALAMTFCQLIESDPSLFSELAFARVGFFEVSQPLRPNTLVDITEVADIKWKAIAAHASQLAIRDYTSFARGLNAFRSMTLPQSSQFAEAYYVTELPALHTTAIGQLRHAMGDARGVVTVDDEPLPISVIVRTKDRPGLLAEALNSIRATSYPAEVIVVNDGGAAPELPAGVTSVTHGVPRGRSAAMNSGVAAAKNAFIAFLDDDDLFYPDHLSVLNRAANGSSHVAWYTDAVSAFAVTGESGALETKSRLRLFEQDFDRDLLFIDNFIPLPTLLLRREDFLTVGGFDTDFDLFEDWDFLIRLAKRGDFVHIPRITCEIRHIEAFGSIVLASPEGSPAFRAAKLKIWQKHSTLADPNVFANAYERQKQRLLASHSDAVEQRGRLHHVETDVARLEREKNQLLGNLQSLHEMTTQQLARIRELEGYQQGIKESLSHALDDSHQSRLEAMRAREEREDARRGVEEMQTTIRSLYAEVHRLQGLLDMIYASKTWKLHTIVEKVRGR